MGEVFAVVGLIGCCFIKDKDAGTNHLFKYKRKRNYNIDIDFLNCYMLNKHENLILNDVWGILISRRGKEFIQF